MPQLPTTQTRRRVATPQRRVQGYSTQAYERGLNVAARSVSDVGDVMGDIGEERYQKQEGLDKERADREAMRLQEKHKSAKKDAVIHAQSRENYAKRQLMDTLYGSDDKDGLYSRKGGNALNLENDFNDEWKTIKEGALSDVTDPDARRALETSLEGMYTSNLGNVKRYRMDERRGYFSNLSNTRSLLAQEQAGLEWNNSESFKIALTDAEESARNSAVMAGSDPDIAAKAAVSSTYTTRIAAMINSGEDDAIMSAAVLYDNARQNGKVMLNDVGTIDTMIDAVLPKVKAKKAFEDFRDNKNITELNTDDIHQAMLQVESGGRHTDAEGNITKSHAGAYGVAQLMPDTAKEITKEMGVAPDYWLTESGNAEMGKYYLDKMVKHFDDKSLGVLAYNWGMGNVQKHIDKVGDPRKGEIAIDDFIAKIDNDEARQYVPKVMQSLGGPTDKLDMGRAQRAAVNMPDKEAALFLKMVDKQNETIDTSLKEEKQQFEEAIHMKVANAGGDYTVLSASEMTQATRLGVDYTKYTGVSDQDALNDLGSMTSNELFAVDLDEYRGQLSFDDINTYKQKQADLQNPSNKLMQDKIDQITRYYFRAELGNDPDNKVYKSQVADMKRFISDSLSSQFEDIGQISDKDINATASAFFKNRIYDPWGLGNRQENIYLMDVGDIPDDIRNSIEQSILNEGKLITENAIKERYILHLGKQGQIQRTK